MTQRTAAGSVTLQDCSNDHNSVLGKAMRDQAEGVSWKHAAPPLLSKTALTSRNTPHIPPPSPASPASPAGSSGGGGSTAVAVAQLYRLPSALYRGGSTTLSTSSTTTGTGAAAAARIVPNSGSSSGGGVGGIGAGVSSAGSVTVSGVAGEPHSREVATAAPRCTWPLQAEARARRSAEAFESGVTAVVGLGTASEELDMAVGVQAARGYRSVSSTTIISEDCGAPHLHTHDLTAAARGRREETNMVVPLVTGSKRRRGQSCSLNCSDISIASGGATAATNGSTRAPLVTSPSFSSLSIAQSPQSPAMPLVRSLSHLCGGSGDVEAASSDTAAGVGGVIPSPFHALLDVLADGTVARPTTTAAPAAAAMATRRSVAAMTVREQAFAAALSTWPWLRLWASHSLSSCLALQMECDADVLRVRALETSAPCSYTSSTILQAVSAGEGSRRSERGDLSVLTGTASFLAPLPAIAVHESAQPFRDTLHDALLRLFDVLERLETETVDLFTAAAPVGGAPTSTRAALATSRHPPKSDFPARPPQSVRESMTAAVQLWCEVLLPQWPCEVTSLGYVEWWLRHPVWASMAQTAPVGGTSEAVASPSSSTAAQQGGHVHAPPPQPPQHLHLLHEVLVSASSEGMQRLFDVIVDTFISAVQDLLRCCTSGSSGISCSSSGAVQAMADTTTSTTATTPFRALSQGAVRTQTTARCQALLRLLVSLYADPPALLTATFREVTPPRTPSSPLSTTSAGDLAAGSRDGQVASSEPSSVQAPGRQQPPHPPPPPPQRTREERSSAREQHYQLLYAVCRLCNELPLRWGETTVAGGPPSPPVPSGEEEKRHNDGDYLPLFAAAVQLSAAIALPLSAVQLPMKGDLLCLAGRLAQQRRTLLRWSLLRERDYAHCMGHLRALLAQAT